MDERDYQRDDFGKSEDGLICKSAEVENLDVTSDDLKKINKFTLTPLTAEEVFTFKVIGGDNEVDDRNFEPFDLDALKDLKKLYIGKTVIKDHFRRADNQIARVYDTELVTEPKLTGAGEPFTKLVLKCYMLKTTKNADLIAEIKAGIKKEVSTGTRPKKAICSICGTDNTKTWCSHFPGREYDTKDGKRQCRFTLSGAKEAYELSFVAVPAQPRAGTTKHYGSAEPTVEKTGIEPEEQIEKQNEEIQESDKLSARLKMLDSFIFTETQKEDM